MKSKQLKDHFKKCSKENKKNTYSQRQLKVGEIIKKSLSDFLYRDTIHDDDLQNVSITITQVTVSPDLETRQLLM